MNEKKPSIYFVVTNIIPTFAQETTTKRTNMEHERILLYASLEDAYDMEAAFSNTITVGDLIKELSYYDPESPIVFASAVGYRGTFHYGSLANDDNTGYADDDNE